MKIGEPLPRVDGPIKVTGAARYTADLRAANMLYGVLVTASIPAGRVVAFEKDDALAEPGVVRVLTHEDMPRARNTIAGPPFAQSYLPMQSDEVRHEGQPIALVDALADQASVPRIKELCYVPGVGILDETIKHVGLSLLPALRAPERVSRLFTDHVTLALAVHTAQTYGGMQMISKPLKGGLSPWQERRSKEMIAGDLTGTTPLREIAEACGLSVSHFSRAFRRSTGLAPHAWLLQARVESAKALLRKRDSSLSTIAQACGFADQSHFSRVFTRRVGLGPGAWRNIVLT
jgi:AraC-like DNA-binding protein